MVVCMCIWHGLWVSPQSLVSFALGAGWSLGPTLGTSPNTGFAGGCPGVWLLMKQSALGVCVLHVTHHSIYKGVDPSTTYKPGPEDRTWSGLPWEGLGGDWTFPLANLQGCFWGAPSPLLLAYFSLLPRGS